MDNNLGTLCCDLTAMSLEMMDRVLHTQFTKKVAQDQIAETESGSNLFSLSWHG
jgi:hypothetical protein